MPSTTCSRTTMSSVLTKAASSAKKRTRPDPFGQRTDAAAAFGPLARPRTALGAWLVWERAVVLPQPPSAGCAPEPVWHARCLFCQKGVILESISLVDGHVVEDLVLYFSIALCITRLRSRCPPTFSSKTCILSSDRRARSSITLMVNPSSLEGRCSWRFPLPFPSSFHARAPEQSEGSS